MKMQTQIRLKIPIKELLKEPQILISLILSLFTHTVILTNIPE